MCYRDFLSNKVIITRLVAKKAIQSTRFLDSFLLFYFFKIIHIKGPNIVVKHVIKLVSNIYQPLSI